MSASANYIGPTQEAVCDNTIMAVFNKGYKPPWIEFLEAAKFGYFPKAILKIASNFMIL